MTEDTILWQHDCPGYTTMEVVTDPDTGEQVIVVQCWVTDGGVPGTIEGAISANAYIIGKEQPVGNLIQDPTFDGGGGTWRGYTDAGAPALDILDTFGRLDNFCARIRGQSLDDQGRWFTERDLPVTPGERYYLSGWMLGDFTNGAPNITVTFWNADLTYAGQSITAHPTLLPLDADWVFAEAKDIIAPAGVAFARVELRARSGLIGEVHFDDIYFGQQAAEPTLEETLMAEADARQVIEFNPNAALQKIIFEHGFVPNSPEFDITFDMIPYRAQRAEHMGTGEVRVYYAVHDKWDAVYYYTRPTQ